MRRITTAPRSSVERSSARSSSCGVHFPHIYLDSIDSSAIQIIWTDSTTQSRPWRPPPNPSCFLQITLS
jgi:hypothetical protein